ncbi:hypothetical protein NPIL_619631 [Nephila pilipes]|uniref:Uncharacterized protein n=1 Tax=Nephila pilipes TaxID=299642 RepID=A0A8X6TPH6_NEPPI|nr:hypothetical protein NPIL_619631 [Nephila pilipes]
MILCQRMIGTHFLRRFLPFAPNTWKPRNREAPDSGRIPPTATLSHLVQGDLSVNKGLIPGFLLARLVCLRIVNHHLSEASIAQLQLCDGITLL